MLFEVIVRAHRSVSDTAHEFVGAHVESGEHPDDCAQRRLYFAALDIRDVLVLHPDEFTELVL